MMVQIIDFCDPNDPEKREGFWMHKLRTFYPDRLIENSCYTLTYHVKLEKAEKQNIT